MRNDSCRSVFVIIILFLTGCKERFEPDVKTLDTGYLVVEGYINSEIGTTVIRLSRTGRLNLGPRAENNAVVRIVGEDLNSYTLTGNGNGVYTSAVLNLPKQRYQLRIKAGGKEYLTELMDEEQTPPIDSLSWKRDADGVRIYVHTHDDANKTKYYKWTFDETWEIRSIRKADLKFKKIDISNSRPQTFIVRTTDEEQDRLYYCWKSEISNEILLGSTAKLAQDRITSPMKFVKNNDERLVFLYSINVVQTALDLGSYNFYQNLEGNTETKGSIFDRQPSETSGNIRCLTDPEEIVIGNVMLTSPQEKRIFIKNVPGWSNNFECIPELDRVYVLHNPDTLAKYNGPHIPLTLTEAAEKTPLHPDSLAKASFYLPVSAIYTRSLPYPVGYDLGDRRCLDCAVRGSNIRPRFWPN